MAVTGATSWDDAVRSVNGDVGDQAVANQGGPRDAHTNTVILCGGRPTAPTRAQDAGADMACDRGVDAISVMGELPRAHHHLVSQRGLGLSSSSPPRPSPDGRRAVEPNLVGAATWTVDR